MSGLSVCPYCGSSALAFFCEGEDRVHHLTTERFRYNQCGTCGAVVIHEQPTSEQIAARYPLGYSAYQAAPQVRDWSMLASLLEQGTVVEVGCAAGNALASFTTFRPEWRITGVDFSEQALAVAAQSVPQGTFIQADIPRWIQQAPTGEADLVICEHVIEHVLDPKDLFHHLMRMLAPGGRLLLSIPNAGSWTMRLFRSSAHHLEAPRHLFIPSHRSITALCKREQSRIIRHEGQTYPSVFSRSLASIAPRATRLFFAMRLPSIIRMLIAPFATRWTAPYSKLTYVITNRSSA